MLDYRSPGFGITLVSSSTTAALHSSEAISSAASDDKDNIPQTPEELGASAAFALLANVQKSSCIDEGMEWLACLLMALGSEDVGRVRLAGPLREDQCVRPKDFL